ncbi:MAG: hypothetical protein K2P27_10950 [Lachnospiraceae bacterium]|nr:hypothetical protein [Lachnospiraceae bacterium]
MKRNIYFLMILTMLLTGCAVPESRIESTEKSPDQIRTEEPADDSVQEKTAPEQDRTLPEASEPDGSDPETASLPADRAEAMEALADQLSDPSMSDYEKVKTFHDYLVRQVNYDYDNLKAGTLPDTAFTAEGALLLHSAVCEGYARAFSYLCRRAGIEEMLVYGTADDGTGVQSHAWNQVCVDGVWYYVDVTWDDPLVDKEVVTDGSNIIYDYFLVPDMTLLGNHTAENPDQLHACTSDRYLEENRRLTIAPYLTEPYVYTPTDEEVLAAVEQYLAEGVLTFQLVCDLTFSTPESRSDLVINHVKDTMTAREQYGEISVETQYGIADYAVIQVTITPP